jgi:hypothetical protein
MNRKANEINMISLANVHLIALLCLHLECNHGFVTFDFLFVHASVGLKHHALKYKC